jgi:hypothetical protein
MADATTKIFHNTTDEPVMVLGVGEIRAHDHVSVTTKYHQPVVLENYPGVVEITDMSPEEQEAFYADERPKMHEAAAPRVEKLKRKDDAANAAEAKAKGLDPPAPIPRFNPDGTPLSADQASPIGQPAPPQDNQVAQGVQQ